VRRGEIRFADLEPVRGSEANKRRPVVIVSNDGANERATILGRGVVTVVPVTSNVTHVLPFQTMLQPVPPGWHARPKHRQSRSDPLTSDASDRASHSCRQR
jgi:mRNA interferase MazF